MIVFGLNVKTVPDTQFTSCRDCVLVELCYPPIDPQAIADGYKIPSICDDDNYHYELED